MDAKQLIESLQLEPLAGEGGYFRRMYESDGKHDDGRRHGASILYMLVAPDFSCFHRVDCDELWYFHTGAPLRLWEIDRDGMLTQTLLGNPTAHADAVAQVCVKKGVWFAAEVTTAKGFSLISCTTIPEFLFSTFELGVRSKLCEEYPHHVDLISRLTRQ